MSSKTYLNILKGGLIASMLIVFFVFTDLLFPYITSKQLSFNILMEILLAVWLVFLMRYPEYRPKKSYITWGLLAYFLAILASCAVSVNIGLSFWGNAERMLGLFHLLHFLIFYFILITVFRSWKDWRALLFSSIVVATLISLIGLFGKDTFSRIGNTAYVSGYLIFNLFFCLILFLRSEYSAWRWLYTVPVGIMFIEFISCHTSGAIIGLFFSLLLLAFLIGLFHKNKLIRRSSLSLMIVAVIGVGLVFSQYKSDWFQNSFLKNFTFQKITFQTRLLSWKSAAEDFKYHPIFGTGFGNYAIVFDKHFDSKFFDYMKSETYFDRAHNNLIDITSTTGLVGLVTYLSIFAAAIYYLVREFKKNGRYAGTGDEESRKNLEILVIIALLTAYFIQNLAVFDSYVTYIGLMMLLGFIYWLVNSDEEGEVEADTDKKRFLTLGRDWEWVVLIVMLIAAYIFTSQYNLKPWRMYQGVINGYSNILQGNLTEGINDYQAALGWTYLDHDGAVTLINLVTSNPRMLSTVSQDKAQAVLDYTISLAEKNVTANPQDSLMQMQLAQVYDAAARFYYEDQEKFNDYSTKALNAIDRSIAASPGRAPVYFMKAQMQLLRQENTEAVKTIEYGISLNPNYDAGYCRLAQLYLFLKDEKKMAEPLNKCLDLGGAEELTSDTFIVNSLNYYATVRDYSHAVKLAERLAEINDTDVSTWLNLAKLYLVSGDAVKAQEASKKAIALDPKVSSEWNNFLANIIKAQDGTAVPSKATK